MVDFFKIKGSLNSEILIENLTNTIKTVKALNGKIIYLILPNVYTFKMFGYVSNIVLHISETDSNEVIPVAYSHDDNLNISNELLLIVEYPKK